MVALWLVAACAGDKRDPGEPVVLQAPVDSMVLAPGQAVEVGRLRLSFQAVQEDSRCPMDVVCVWQGNAAVAIVLGLDTGPASAFTLNTADGRPAVEHGGYRVTLLGLTPAPRSTDQISPDAYRASIRVEAAD
jgi:hypothetical protein